MSVSTASRHVDPTRRQQAVAAWVLALPFTALFLVFTAGPVLASLGMSFTDIRSALRHRCPVFLHVPRQTIGVVGDEQIQRHIRLLLLRLLVRQLAPVALILVVEPAALSAQTHEPLHHPLLAEHVTAEYCVKTEGRAADEWKLRSEQPDNHRIDCLVGAAV